MKLKTEVVIDADRATVWKLFDDPDNLKKWQPMLDAVEHVSGTRGQPDAISRLVYDENGRKVTMTETITARREPDFIGGTYESDRGTAVILNRFEDAGDGRTRWIGHWNQRFRGAMKAFAFLFRRSMRKRIEADMRRFRDFVATETGGRSA